jgi:hypothetical protein
MKTTSALCVAALCASTIADVHLTRTISNVETGFDFSINLAAGCSSTDQYGCADINLGWGTDTLASINTTVPKNFTEKSKVTGKIKVTAALVPVNVDVNCPVCGGTAAAPAECSIDLPLGLKPAKIKLSPCPVIAVIDKVTVTNISLPDKSPLGLVGAKLSGSVTLFDDDGISVIEVALDGKIDHK